MPQGCASRRRVRLLGSLVAGCGVVVGLSAPAVAAAAQRPADTNATEPDALVLQALARPAGLNVAGIPLDAALRELHQSTRIPLLFSPSLLPASHVVTCDCRAVTVADALDRLLNGTVLEYVVEAGQVVIAPRPEPERAPEAPRFARIRGQLVEHGSGAAIVGAFVLLFDEAGHQRGGSLTDEDGRFTLSSVRPGQYTIRAERIGYRIEDSAPLLLWAGQVLDYRLAVQVEPVVLAGIQVQADARRRCVLQPEDGLYIAQLWDEARKAFRGTALSAEQGFYRFRVRQIERHLEPRTLRVLDERIRARALVGEVPFVSRAPEDLVERGFIQTLGDDTYFYAPDAAVLLSDRFAETHCFRVVDGPVDEPDVIGIGFQPVRGHRVPGIRGVLWMDRATGELQHLEYRYSGVPFDIPGEHIGGRVEFRRLENGAWIIPRWWIRTPFLETRRVMVFDRMRTNVSLVGIKEEGAEIVDIEGAGPAKENGPREADPPERGPGGSDRRKPGAPPPVPEPIPPAGPGLR